VRKFADDLSYLFRDINQYSAVNVMGSEWQVCDLNEVDVISRDGGGLASRLAQVKKIVGGHQGEVSVRSTVGPGSVFSIILPIDKVEL